MSKKRDQMMIEHFRREAAAAAYENQTPEQRESFLARIASLNAVKINRDILTDNWGHILSAEPENKKSIEYKTFKDMLKYYRETMDATKMLDVRMSNLLATSDTGKDLVDQYAWYNAAILKLLFGLDAPKQELALDVIKAISAETFNAQSDEDYEKNMIEFGSYCLSLSEKGRKNITKNDFKKFNDGKTK